MRKIQQTGLIKSPEVKNFKHYRPQNIAIRQISPFAAGKTRCRVANTSLDNQQTAYPR
jgi:hypothetical protein